MQTVHVDIVSAERAIHSGEATLVVVPLAEGEAGILAGHSPLFATLKAGAVRLTDAEGVEHGFYVSGGFIEVQPRLVTVLADSGERAADLDEVRAAEAVRAAEHALTERRSEIDYALAEAELAEAVMRLRVIRNLKVRLRPDIGGGARREP